MPCGYAGGTTPRMGEVDGVGNTPSRVTPGAVTEDLTLISARIDGELYGVRH